MRGRPRGPAAIGAGLRLGRQRPAGGGGLCVAWAGLSSWLRAFEPSVLGRRALDADLGDEFAPRRARDHPVFADSQGVARPSEPGRPEPREHKHEVHLSLVVAHEPDVLDRHVDIACRAITVPDLPQCRGEIGAALDRRAIVRRRVSPS